MSLVLTAFSDVPTAKNLFVGIGFVVGSALLLPGFNMIAPDSVLEIPEGPVTIYIPHFKEEYSTGINLIIVGVGLIIFAAIGQLILTCQVKAPLVAKFGAAMLLAGSCLLEAGSVIFMPQFARPNDAQHRPPATIAGELSTDLASKMFQAASCVYLVSALTAIFGSALKINTRRVQGRSTVGACFEVWAFALFIPVSVLFFANGLLPNQDALKAGTWRMIASLCLFSACALLFVITSAEFVHSRRQPAQAAKLVDADP